MLLLYVADMMLLCRLMLGSWYSIVGLHQVSEESPCARFKFCIQGCSVICFFGDNLILADYTALPSVALGTSFASSQLWWDLNRYHATLVQKTNNSIDHIW